jgi:FkbM family methyltransferase
MECTFTNDDGVTILLIDDKISDMFKTRDNHEVIFRRINTYLIKNKIIQNNIIDLGAWIGDNSIPWAKNIDGIVYAIDPCHENCDFINKTCEVNQIKNVKTIQCAISNVNELLTTNDNLFHCSFIYGNPLLSGINKVNAVSLDFLYETKHIENIGYIHLDVEGMEYKVIEGSRNLIDNCRPIISFEQHLLIDDYDIILSYFKNKNYRVFLIDEILPGCRYDCRNSFAFPNEICNESLIENIHHYIGQNVLISK